jgi:hypothetical protein
MLTRSGKRLRVETKEVSTMEELLEEAIEEDREE